MKECLTMKWPKADAPTYHLGLQRPPVNMADALRMEGKQKTEETKQDVPDDQRKQSKNLYEDAEWSGDPYQNTHLSIAPA